MGHQIPLSKVTGRWRSVRETDMEAVSTSSGACKSRNPGGNGENWPHHLKRQTQGPELTGQRLFKRMPQFLGKEVEPKGGELCSRVQQSRWTFRASCFAGWNAGVWQVKVFQNKNCGEKETM